MNERPERRQSVIVGLAFACLLAAGTGLIFLIGRHSGPGARLAGGLVALGGGVGAVLAVVALVRETAREASSDEDRLRGRIVIWAMFGFVATDLTVGPALGVGLDVNGWIIVAVAGPMVVLTMSVTTRFLRATGAGDDELVAPAPQANGVARDMPEPGRRASQAIRRSRCSRA
jgi:hypothetical protein